MQSSLLVASLVFAACHGSSGAAAPTRPAPRAPLTLSYLGVAGWQLDAPAARVLVDPYYSRPDLDAPLLPDAAAIAARAPAAADLVLVTHTHADHALDAPAVAQRTGAELLGTPSTILLAQASGVPDAQLVPVRGGEDYAWPQVSVRAIPALHSALDDRHPTTWLGTSFAAPPTLPLTMPAYPEGGTLAYLVRLGGHQVFVLSSANFIERELVGVRPDVAIVGTGLRELITDYTCRLLHALGDPPVVIPTHFDDWHAPPATTPPPADDDVHAFAAEVQACAPGTRVIIPTPFTPITVP